MKRALILHGPNLNLTGIREPEVYGRTTLEEIDRRLRTRGAELDLELRCLQSNHEGALIDALHEARSWAQGGIFNPGALAHYSYALRDAVAAAGFPVIEVHMSLTVAREEFRHRSVIAPVCAAQLAGFGWYGYILALDGLNDILGRRA